MYRLISVEGVVITTGDFMKKRFIEEFLFGNELINWQMKMNEPLKAKKLTKEEVEKVLKK